MEVPDLIKGLVAGLVEEIVEASLPPVVLETLHLQPQVKEIMVVAGQAMRLLIILPLVAVALVQWVLMEHQLLAVMVGQEPRQLFQAPRLLMQAVVAAAHLVEELRGVVALVAVVLDQQVLEMASPVLQTLVAVEVAVAHLLVQVVLAVQAALASSS